jgi:hypothetical protein
MSLLFDAWPDRSVDECFTEAARYCGLVHMFLLQVVWVLLVVWLLVLMLPLLPLMTNTMLLAMMMTMMLMTMTMMMAIDGDDAMTNIFAAGGARRTRRFLTVKQRLFIAVSPSKRAQSIGRLTSTRTT